MKKFMPLSEMQYERETAITDESKQFWRTAIDDYFLNGRRIEKVFEYPRNH